VVAESVETVEQQQALRELSCELAQGYLYARPLTAEGVVAYLDECCGEPLTKTEDAA
jgi:EAL domain-containing protein (putative c-di-GMP-specific phosphodiesterase class I)